MDKIRNILRRILKEGYNGVTIDHVKSKKKVGDYKNYTDKTIINGNTYLNTSQKDDDWFLWGEVIVFDKEDGTEIANASYGKEKEDSPLKASIDIRPDKRRGGIASNIYKWIEKTSGFKLHPDTPHSKAAEALWNNPNREFGFDK